MSDIDKLRFEKEFRNAKDLKEFRNNIAALTGSPPVLMKILVQGYFHIANTTSINNELDLRYEWYKVTKIGSSYIEVYVHNLKKKFKVYPDLGFTFHQPTVTIYADNFNRVIVERN